MEFKKQFKSSVEFDFSNQQFYKIPHRFFAEWLNVVLEIAKVLQPGFDLDIPEKNLEWYQFPDREVFDLDGGTVYTLRTSSLILKNETHSIQVLAQYGYENIPWQHILIKLKLASGTCYSRNNLNDNLINFDIEMDEKHLPAIQEVFNLFS